MDRAGTFAMEEDDSLTPHPTRRYADSLSHAARRFEEGELMSWLLPRLAVGSNPKQRYKRACMFLLPASVASEPGRQGRRKRRREAPYYAEEGPW